MRAIKYCVPGTGIFVGTEDVPGVPAKEMNYLGTDEPLSLKDIKDHYDALGSYLHIPTISQLQKTSPVDFSKLRKRCEQSVAIIEKVLSSSVFDTSIGAFSSINCSRCSAEVRKRLPIGTEELIAKCFGCGAEYKINHEDRSNTMWQPITQTIPCPTNECKESIEIWNDAAVDGFCWQCEGCGHKFAIHLGVMLDE